MNLTLVTDPLNAATPERISPATSRLVATVALALGAAPVSPATPGGVTGPRRRDMYKFTLSAVNDIYCMLKS